MKRSVLRVLGVIDDISLMITNEDVENIGREINNLRIAILQVLCLQRLSKEEADKENKGINTLNGKEINSGDRI